MNMNAGKKIFFNEVYSAHLYIVLHFTQSVANIYAMQCKYFIDLWQSFIIEV